MSILHTIEVPKIAHRRLTELVSLQIALLTYGASTKDIGETTCANYLQTTMFAPYKEKIIQWLFRKNATKRRELLDTFARTYKEGITDEHVPIFRAQWLTRIHQEIRSLLDTEEECLHVQAFYVDEHTHHACKKDAAPDWQRAAANFFLYFYETYLGDDETFPGTIFADQDTAKFGRNDILHEFINENTSLEICAICDQSRYYAHGQDKIHSILDHYFPKETYPHFACHPHNLIPVCYPCNSSFKATKDPFLDTHGQRRPLHKKSLPYQQNLAGHVYLEVTPGTKSEMITIGRLCIQVNGDTPAPVYVEEAIDLLQEIYELPERWGRGGQSMRIHDVLFRRMRHFLDEGRAIQHGNQIDTEVYNTLRQLLYYLAVEDQRHDPFGFALTWMLTAYLKEKDKEHSPSWKGLIAEINSWSGQSLDENIKRDDFVKRLLERLP
jgi:hypothetical protein